MTFKELVTLVGWDQIKRWFVVYVGNTPTHGKYTNVVCGRLTEVINTKYYGGVHAETVREYLEAYALVQSHGGLNNARKEAHKNCFSYDNQLMKACYLMREFEK